MSADWVIGVDPDSVKHGVAIYHHKKLVELLNLELMGLMEKALEIKATGETVIASVENVSENPSIWHNQDGNKRSFGKTSYNVGKCAQAQCEVSRMFKHIGIEQKLKKVSKKWKSQNERAIFEKVTGWSGRSNEDTRSAAYFGFLEI